LPDRFQYTIHLVGDTYPLNIPWGACLAIAVYALFVRRLSPPASAADAMARAAGVAIVADVVLLLAIYTHYLDMPAAFASPVYLIYARVFCAAALAALIAWTTAAGFEALVPIALAAIVYAVALARADLPMFLAGAAAGAALVAVWPVTR